jgi:nitrous oxidase accessory protein NosD
MKTQLATSLLALAAILPASAAAPVVFEPVALTDAAPIQWEGRAHETIDARRIGGPVSIKLESCSDITISACDLRSIELIDCQDITIRNCYIHDSARIGVQIGAGHGIVVEGCRLENLSTGVYACGAQSVQVRGNFGRNFQGPLPRGQLAQFDSVTGPGNAICDNYGINERGHSHPEDVINLYQSTGTANSPILVENNYVTGDPTAGSMDKSENGSGIMLGDLGGAHILCRKNVILAAGQCGLGVAGGTDIRVEDNLILGGISNVTTSGLYVWNQSSKPSDHVTVIHNRVSWLNKDGEETSWWDGGGVQQLEQRDNRFADTTLPSAIPAPPSVAPLPPKPWTSPNTAAHTLVARLPWKIQ